MALGFALAPWYFYIRRPDMPGASPKRTRSLYQFLLNKWYFDEIYDFMFVNPAKWLGRFSLEEGRRLAHRRLRSGRGRGARVLMSPTGWCRIQTGYVYPLRLCHADRGGALVTYMFGGFGGGQ